MPPEVLLLYRTVLAILGFSHFHMKLSTILLSSVKNFAGMELNMYIAFGKIAIFTMLILPTQEYGRSFYSLVSFLISFFKDLKFLSYKSSTCLVRVTPRYFMYLWLL